ncbi:MAG: hypothetical protein WC998_00680 [Candidatus Paceibacterota bacterium]|jgi:hypothetical protein
MRAYFKTYLTFLLVFIALLCTQILALVIYQECAYGESEREDTGLVLYIGFDLVENEWDVLVTPKLIELATQGDVTIEKVVVLKLDQTYLDQDCQGF